MEISLRSARPESVRTGLLALQTTANPKDPLFARLDRATGGHLSRFLRRRGFKGGDGPVVYQVPPGALPQEYLLLSSPSSDRIRSWRALADATVLRARELRLRSVAVVTPAEVVEVVAETIELTGYQFAGIRSGRRHATVPRIVLVSTAGRAAATGLSRGRALGGAACTARDLVNLPADVVTPESLAAIAQRVARSQGLQIKVLNERAMKRLAMGALLGVARGSDRPPRFIEMIYRPRGARQRIALVGKGITFDSGGLSLKSPESMQTQKRDMAGAAVVLGVMSAVRDLGIRVEVRGYIPAAENMPSGRALKPGDVLTACNGRTIEVLNTDAEGRLVLADALSIAARSKPDAMVDFATLTAAVRTALGPRYAAVMSTAPALTRALIEAGNASGENLWELPLVDEYRRDLDSQVADIKNTGEGHSGTIIGGLFLREFAAGVPWAHIDFSSTVVTEKPFPAHPRGASGFGVRLMLRYLASL